MLTLFLSAPGSSQTGGGVRTFDLPTIFAIGTAPDYAITESLQKQMSIGMRVIVFDRDRNQQMVGVIRNFRPTTKAANGIQRYDIDIEERAMVPYSYPPRVNPCGVAIN